MRVTILTSSKHHPVYSRLVAWIANRRGQHDIQLIVDPSLLHGGDILFLVSCHHVVTSAQRALFRATLVIHASNLPEGRGWSPLEWQILEGRTEVVVTLLEASERVDRGDIWRQERLRFEGHELGSELRQKLFDTELRLMDYAINNIDNIEPLKQSEEGATYYRRRGPEDSRIDPTKSIDSQFDALRIADPDRFPSFFELRGHRYLIRIEKVQEDRQ